MRTKHTIIAWLISLSTLIAQEEETTLPRGIEGSNFGAAYFMNTKYGYGGVSLHYFTPKFIYKNKVGLKTSIDGYRITQWVITEYTRLNIEAEYLIALHAKGSYKHALVPKAGFSFILDITNGSTRLWGFAGRVGVDYTGQLNRFLFSLENTITIFSDGMWIEPIPGVAFNIYKSIYIELDMMMPFAFTYNGNTDIGFHPRLGIKFLPLRKQ